MNIDFTGIVVACIALVFLNMQPKWSFHRERNFWFMNIGLVLLLFSAILDFVDSLSGAGINRMLNQYGAFYDFLEDQIGGGLGLVVFVYGAFDELFNI